MVVCIWTMEVDKGLTLCTWCIFPDPGMLHGSFQAFHFRSVKNSVLRWTCRLSNRADLTSQISGLRSNGLAML